MFNDDDIKSTIIKTVAMLAIIAAEWYMMQPYNEPLIPRLYQMLARFFYRLAYRFGSTGLSFEAKYNEAIA